MAKTDLFLVNGKPATDNSLLANRALAYGDGIFETMRLCKGKLPLWPRHLQRLLQGREVLGLSFDDAHIQATLKLSLQHLPPEANGILKLHVSRKGNFRASYACGPQRVDILVYYSARHFQQGWLGAELELKTASGVLSPCPSLAGIKHCSRLSYIVAAKNVKHLRDDQEVLFLDRQNNIVETMHHNIFVVKEGALHTPALVEMGVKGVLRTTLIDDYASHCGVKVYRRAIPYEELQSVDEIFLTNAVAGVVPVNKIDGLQVQQQWPGAAAVSSWLSETF